MGIKFGHFGMTGRPEAIKCSPIRWVLVACRGPATCAFRCQDCAFYFHFTDTDGSKSPGHVGAVDSELKMFEATCFREESSFKDSAGFRVTHGFLWCSILEPSM